MEGNSAETSALALQPSLQAIGSRPLTISDGELSCIKSWLNSETSHAFNDGEVLCVLKNFVCKMELSKSASVATSVVPPEDVTLSLRRFQFYLALYFRILMFVV